MTIPLTHRELLWWMDVISDGHPNWSRIGRQALVAPGRLRAWQLDAPELIAVCSVIDDALIAEPASLSPLADQFSVLRKIDIARGLEVHYASRNSGTEHRCSIVLKGGDCSWEAHVMRVFDLLPHEGWPPMVAPSGDDLARDISEGIVRARPDDVLALLAARIEWLKAALTPLADRPLPPTMYQDCPHCGYKWRMRPRRADAAELRCPGCRASIDPGTIIACRHCGESWRQKGAEPPARCPRCNKARPVLAVREGGEEENNES